MGNPDRLSGRDAVSTREARDVPVIRSSCGKAGTMLEQGRSQGLPRQNPLGLQNLSSKDLSNFRSRAVDDHEGCGWGGFPPPASSQHALCRRRRTAYRSPSRSPAQQENKGPPQKPETCKSVASLELQKTCFPHFSPNHFSFRLCPGHIKLQFHVTTAPWDMP